MYLALNVISLILKLKDWLSAIYWQHQILHGKSYFLFPGVLKRSSFQKNFSGTWFFLYYWERWYFFFLKIWSYSYTLGGKWKMIFLKKMHGNIIFSSNFLKRWSFQKGPRWDMNSSNSLYFHGGLYRRFHVPLSSEKKTGNLIYKIEVWLLLEFIQLEIFQ